MSNSDRDRGDAPVIVIVERRKRQVELSSAEVMRIVRKRAAAKRGGSNTEHG